MKKTKPNIDERKIVLNGQISLTEEEFQKLSSNMCETNPLEANKMNILQRIAQSELLKESLTNPVLIKELLSTIDALAKELLNIKTSLIERGILDENS